MCYTASDVTEFEHAMADPRQKLFKQERWSRRQILRHLAAAGGLSLAGFTGVGCGLRPPDPSGMFQGIAGQARQATGSAPPPKQLHWITPISAPADALAAARSDADRSQAVGWQRMLDPWKAGHPDITLVHHFIAPADLLNRQTVLAKSGGPADVAYTDSGGVLGQAGIVDPLDVGPLARKIVGVALSPQSALNQVYALPIFVTCLGLYVNQQRFQEADLNPATQIGRAHV